MRKVTFIVALFLLSVSLIATAQEDPLRVDGFKPIDTITFDLKSNLADPDFRMSSWVIIVFKKGKTESLELTPEQHKDFTALMTSSEEKFLRELNKLTDGQADTMPGRDRIEFDKRAYAMIDKELIAGIDKILLPHQRAKLNRMATAEYFKNASIFQLLESKWTREVLEISDEQMAKMAERLRKELAECQEEVEELVREADANILSELEPDQRKQLDGIMGK